MRIYLSSFTESALLAYVDRFENAKLNILISYAFRNKHYNSFIKKYNKNINSLILDSGAYTMNNAKSEKLRDSISFDGYKSFCRHLGHEFDFAFNFDADFSSDGFTDNYYYLEELEKEGLNPVPVLHDYTGTEADFYAQGERKLIALGYSENKKKIYFKPMVEKLHKYSKQVHLLGKSGFDALYDLPIAYSDSSSWAQNQRFSCICFWRKSKISSENKTETIYFKDSDIARVQRKNWYDEYKYREELETYLKETFDYNYYDLLDIDIGRSCREVVNIHHFVTLQEIITGEHLKRGWKFST